MKKFSTRWMMVASLAGIGAAALAAGCGSDSTGGGTGGHTGGGTGGSAATDAGPPLVNYTFDTDVQGWTLSNYADTMSVNLAGQYVVDGGAVNDAGIPDAGVGAAVPTISFDSADGSPANGSLKVTATFTDYKQYVDAIVNISPNIDLTKKIITAKLKYTGNFSGGAQLHATSGAPTFAYGSSAISGLTAATFVSGQLDTGLVVTTGFDPSMIGQIGIQIFSGDPVADAGTYQYAGVPVVFNIDTVVSKAE
jgi:hypothetical protein